MYFVKSTRKANIAIVGATGQVGKIMRSILEEVVVAGLLPVNNVRFFASAKSAGKSHNFNHKRIVVEDLSKANLEGIDIAIFSAGGNVSLEYAPKFAKAGAIVIDNSSAWRKDPDVPLVVAEVNPEDCSTEFIKKGIIANPNCTTMAAMPVLKVLHDNASMSRLIVSTYQAVSGAGVAGIHELTRQTYSTKSPLELTVDGGINDVPSEMQVKFKRPIAFNVVPYAGDIVNDGSLETDEEQKLRDESRKILHIPELLVSGTCVRVPVFSGHGLSINAEFERDITPEIAIKLLSDSANKESIIVDEIPTPRLAAGKNPSFVGRIRADQSAPKNKGLSMFIANDNLRKGAALNALQIAGIVNSKY
ncbi:MAG: aspartate-semialdehyde dehydrogenase [Bifidobacteriaceae bacterium]|jgi:aspartate-semialdehyde dehydrogenase|nr:aspartate-semialdehyde dehydrogenase [Bifidobacteriaceae bacterium]